MKFHNAQPSQTLNSTGYIITYTTYFIAQAKIWNMLSKKTQKKLAIEELYVNLQNEIDQLSNVHISAGGSLETIGEPLAAYYDESIIRIKIKDLKTLITSAIDENDDDDVLDHLINIRDILTLCLTKFGLRIIT